MKETLTISDLKLVLQVIRVVSARGAIQPEEMVAIGTLHEKISTFIQNGNFTESTENTINEVNAGATPAEGELNG